MRLNRGDEGQLTAGIVVYAKSVGWSGPCQEE